MNPILVTGASGRVGRATLKALLMNPGVKLKATAKSEGMEKLKEFKVDQIEADGRHKDDALQSAFEGVRTAVVIVPSEGRSFITYNFISQAKVSGVTHAVVLSARVVGCAGYASTRFGRQFKQVEEAWKESSIPYTIIRLPFFLENQYANAASIKKRNEICFPVAADRTWLYISVDDVGKAFAAVALHPENHINQTYTLNGPDALTCNQLAEYYGECLRKEVRFTECAWWHAVQEMCDVGIPAWKAEGLVELWQLIEERAPEMSEINGTLEKLTGSKGISAKEWIQSNISKFQ